MIYRVITNPMPTVHELYAVQRDTVWKCSHTQHLAITVLRGECSFTVGNREHRLGEGECIIIPAGEEYERRPISEGESELVYVHFSCELTPVPREEREYLIRELSLSEFGENGLLVNGVTDLGDTEPCRRMLLEASVELKDRKPLRGAVAGLLFYRYLIELSRVRLKEVATVKESEVGRALPVPLQRALEHLKANFNRRVTVPELCRASNVTPQHLIRLFNKYLGASPIKYINRNKILSAVEMLRSTEKSVKEISYELGFENPNYFSRIFAREMGCSPAQKRDHIRNYQRKDNQKA